MVVVAPVDAPMPDPAGEGADAAGGGIVESPVLGALMPGSVAPGMGVDGDIGAVPSAGALVVEGALFCGVVCAVAAKPVNDTVAARIIRDFFKAILLSLACFPLCLRTLFGPVGCVIGRSSVAPHPPVPYLFDG